ncbi:MAG: IgGFc-binding protein, partial [bacterium]|nr:IgGFc-binding protein [Candidatus Kapabacteria bacterium]
MALRHHICTALLVAASLFFAQHAHAALDNKGTEFVFGFIPAYIDSSATATVPPRNVTIELHLVADVNTSVTINYPVENPTTTITATLVAGVTSIVTLPSHVSQSWNAGGPQNNAVRAYASDEFSCVMVNRQPQSSDAALALPVDVLNTEYIALTYYSDNDLAVDRSEFLIVAAYDNTTVVITPKKALHSGQTAGVPFSVVLDKGEGFLATGTVARAAGDLTGSLVRADKPVAMTNGNKLAQVTAEADFGDHIFEVAQPTQTWGDTVLVRNLPRGVAPSPNYSVYRIIASVDGTTVYRDGVSLGVINRGQFFERIDADTNHVFVGTKPILVAQYMTSYFTANTRHGDPSMCYITPVEQYGNAHTFSTVGGDQFTEDYVTIIAKSTDAGSLTLDGVAIASTEYKAIGTTGYKSVAKLLSNGTHTTSSTSGHFVTVEGFG